MREGNAQCGGCLGRRIAPGIHFGLRLHNAVAVKGVFSITVRIVCLALVGACGGFAAYADTRTHEIPDLAWMLGLVGAAIIAAAGGMPTWISAAGGAAIKALAFLPGVLVRQVGLPAFPAGDYLLVVALGALAGTRAVSLALVMVAGIGVVYGGGLVAMGAIQERNCSGVYHESYVELAGRSPATVMTKQPCSWWATSLETLPSKPHDKVASGGEQTRGPYDEESCVSVVRYPRERKERKPSPCLRG